MRSWASADGETTPDGKFTVESVACLGCCSLAPVMMIGDETFGRLTPDSAREIVKNFGEHEWQPPFRALRSRVGLGSCGIAAGAGAVVMRAFEAEVKKRGLPVRAEANRVLRHVLSTSRSSTSMTPALGKVTYGGVDTDSVERIIEEHVVGGTPVGEWVVRAEGEDLPDESYNSPQVRLVLANAGVIDPESIDEYIAAGGYEALEKALTAMTPGGGGRGGQGLGPARPRRGGVPDRRQVGPGAQAGRAP